jgi:uncharacterized protein (DUF305 family)
MNPAPFDIWQSLASAGLPALLMGIAVWYLQRGNTSLVAALNAERSERLDGMEAHIVACDADRLELRNMLLHHLGAVSKNANHTLP